MVGQNPLFTRGSGVRDERYDEYLLWVGSRTAKDFVNYIKNVRGVYKLSHSGILNDAGIAIALARSNPLIKKHLMDMEKELIRLGHIPDPDKQNTSNGQNSPKTLDKINRTPRSQCSVHEKQRIDELEQEVTRLKIERDDAREALKRYGLHEKYMSETMRWPR